MPRGPLGGPRPGASSKLVIMVKTEERVPIQENPFLIEDINNSMTTEGPGPGFPADTIESLEGGTTGGVFSEFLGGEEIDPVQLSGAKGVFMTFSFPSLTEDQIDETVAAVQDATGIRTTGFAVAVL